MRTRVSTKGQVVLPSRIRRRLGLRAGDSLGVELQGDRIILVPHSPSRRKARVVKDPVTGLPVLDLGPNAPFLTSEEVAEILADFP